MSAGPRSLWRLQGNSVPCFSICFQYYRQLFGIPWLVDASIVSPHLSSCSILHVSLHFFPPYKLASAAVLFLPGNQSYWIRVYLNDFILTWLQIQRSYFQIRLHLRFWEDRTSPYLLKGTQCNPYCIETYIFPVQHPVQSTIVHVLYNC